MMGGTRIIPFSAFFQGGYARPACCGRWCPLSSSPRFRPLSRPPPALHASAAPLREPVPILARGPSLVGILRKMADSPFYRVSPQPVESIGRAVVMLGNEGIRSLSAASLTQPIFHIAGGVFPRFPEIAWEHAFRSASATVTHAAIVEKSDPFAAQLLGLVSGLAGIVVFRVVLDLYEAHPKLHPD